MKKFKELRRELEESQEKLDHEFVQNHLAGKDINSKLVGKKTLVVHKDNVKDAKKHLKSIGYHNNYVVSSGIDEETEQLDELSKNTLISYVEKSIRNHKDKVGDASWAKDRAKNDDVPAKNSPYSAEAEKMKKLADKRAKGIGKAISKITEESAQLDEVSKKITGSIHDWKSKLPNDISHIDSTEESNKSHAYKMVNTPDGKKKQKVGTYYHRSGYGDINESEKTHTLVGLDNRDDPKGDFGGTMKRHGVTYHSDTDKSTVFKVPNNRLNAFKKEARDMHKVSLHVYEEGHITDESEQLDEISKKTLANYVGKAADDIHKNSRYQELSKGWASAAKKDGKMELAKMHSDNYHDEKTKIMKRKTGIANAVSKLTKESVELEEGHFPLNWEKMTPEAQKQWQKDRQKKQADAFKNVYGIFKQLKDRDTGVKEEVELKDACWKGYTAIGTKNKNGKKVPNCVPVKEEVELEEASEQVSADYKTDKRGRKYPASRIIFKDGQESDGKDKDEEEKDMKEELQLDEMTNKHRIILSTMDAYKRHSEHHAKAKAEGNKDAMAHHKDNMKQHSATLKKLLEEIEPESTYELTEEISEEVLSDIQSKFIGTVIDLSEGLLSYSDFRDKIDAHKKAGHQVSDTKHSDSHSHYTVIDKHGYGRKYEHLADKTRVTSLGKVKEVEEEEADEPKKRGRKAGSTAGSYSRR